MLWAEQRIMKDHEVTQAQERRKQGSRRVPWWEEEDSSSGRRRNLNYKFVAGVCFILQSCRASFQACQHWLGRPATLHRTNRI